MNDFGEKYIRITDVQLENLKLTTETKISEGERN